MIRQSTFHRIGRQLTARLDAYVESLFPPADETRLIEVLGGTTFTVGGIRRNGRQLTVVLSRGQLLRSERFRRAALNQDGVLANDIQWAIKIRGHEYEHDVVAAYELDERMRDDGWRVRNIPARWLYEQPEKVRSIVQSFIYA